MDHHSRCTWVYLMHHKSQTQTIIQSFFNLIETQYNKTIKVVRTDQGPKFNLRNFFESKGVVHQKSCTYTPQQNSVVERKHLHLLSVARALRFQAILPLIFWGNCVLTAAYLINRIPTPILHNKTPYEVLNSRTPFYSHL